MQLGAGGVSEKKRVAVATPLVLIDQRLFDLTSYLTAGDGNRVDVDICVATFHRGD